MKIKNIISVMAAILVVSACGSEKTDDSAGEGSAIQSGETERADENAAVLAVEKIPNVLTLPADYPDTWFFAHDVNFFNMPDGKVVILDAAAETQEYKGQLPAGNASGFAYSKKRKELYIAETLHEFRVRGKRHDFLIAYDTATLTPKYEIELPPKRFQSLPFRNTLVLLDNDRFALVYNFTPAASVTIVDLEKQAVAAEAPIPGCSLMYPTGVRSFSTICGNGALTTIKLDENGNVVGQSRSEPFIDIDDDALFQKFAVIDGIHYFPTFQGNIQPIDFRSEEPVILKSWPLINGAERSRNTRPGGWQLIANSASGEIFILVHEDGYEGSHKDPATQAWVYSVKAKKKTRIIELKNPALSIAVTQGEKPYLIAFNVDLELDIYDAASGEWLRKIGGLATETAFGVYAVE